MQIFNSYITEKCQFALQSLLHFYSTLTVNIIFLIEHFYKIIYYQQK